MGFQRKKIALSFGFTEELSEIFYQSGITDKFLCDF
jgi:hypothetical protein